jgi:hypothetical protein
MNMNALTDLLHFDIFFLVLISFSLFSQVLLRSGEGKSLFLVFVIRGYLILFED